MSDEVDWLLSFGSDGFRTLLVARSDEIEALDHRSDRAGPFLTVEVGRFREQGIAWTATSFGVYRVSWVDEAGRDIEPPARNPSGNIRSQWVALLPEGPGRTTLIAFDDQEVELGRMVVANDGSAIHD